MKLMSRLKSFPTLLESRMHQFQLMATMNTRIRTLDKAKNRAKANSKRNDNSNLSKNSNRTK